VPTFRLAAAVVVVAFAVVQRTFGAALAPAARAVPCDSWCRPEEPATASTGGDKLPDLTMRHPAEVDKAGP
jgi:hypothetical protein